MKIESQKTENWDREEENKTKTEKKKKEKRRKEKKNKKSEILSVNSALPTLTRGRNSNAMVPDGNTVCPAGNALNSCLSE